MNKHKSTSAISLQQSPGGHEHKIGYKNGFKLMEKCIVGFLPLSTFPNMDTLMGPQRGAADTPKTWDPIQRDLPRPPAHTQHTAHGNLVQFNKARCWCYT